MEIAMADENAPYAVSKENSLRKKLGSGVQINKIFTPKKIEECQNIINTRSCRFF